MTYIMRKKMTNEDKTWPHWTDPLGNLIFPGDVVAISTINGRSPQLVIARVDRINRVNSRGEEIVARKSISFDEPVQRLRYDGTPYLVYQEYREVPSCTITATPIIDARGFSRSSTYTGEPVKKVTYSIPENIIRIELNTDEEI